MALTVINISSKTASDQYVKETVTVGNQLIVVLPADGILTIQLNAASGTDTIDVLSSTEEYSLLTTASDLTDFAPESSETGSAIKRSIEHGCTAYAVDVTAGTYTVRMRALRKAGIYRS